MEKTHEPPERNLNEGDTPANNSDKNNNEGCQKSIISGLIWGGIVYYFLQKKMFVLDSFYGGDGF